MPRLEKSTSSSASSQVGNNTSAQRRTGDRSDGNNEIGETPNGKKRRGNYASYTPQQRIEIGAFSIGTVFFVIYFVIMYLLKILIRIRHGTSQQAIWPAREYGTWLSR